MKTIFVDDEPWAMKRLQEECDADRSFEVMGTFSDPEEALAYASENHVDLAILDIEMTGMNGIELGKHLRELNKDMVIIYVTAFDEYAVESLKMKADYFVLKPCSKLDIDDIISRAKLLSRRQVKRVLIRTFGSFDIFVDGKQVSFKSGKAKELLALLVDKRGTVLTTEEALGIVWGDKPANDASYSLCRKAFARLQKVLDYEGIGDIVITTKEGRCLDTSKVSCDYYLFLDGNARAEERFRGEYLTNYDWAEATQANLIRIAAKR